MMIELFSSLFALETLAVVLAIVYLLLAADENLLCWYCAFASSLIYVYVFFDVSLLMESALNVFYVVMAVIGWYAWHKGSYRNDGDSTQTSHKLQISTLSVKQHVLTISAILVMAVVNGWLMEHFTSAARPFLDSFTTWGAVVTTFMVVRKILDNWVYWIVLDSISIYLYVDRGLYLTASLFVAYVVIAVFGYFQWRQHYQRQSVTQVA